MKKARGYLFLIAILAVVYLGNILLLDTPKWKIIVPKDFKGRVQIICNNDSTLRFHEVENPSRKLLIPENGTLYLEYLPESLASHYEIYYANDGGKLRKIDLENAANPEDNVIKCLEQGYVVGLNMSDSSITRNSFFLTFIISEDQLEGDCQDL
ncbi:MAG: hypothetical protein AAFU33_18860 [Bacteroidota bacterium]